MKFEFCEFLWAERPEWIAKAKAATITICETKYKSASLATSEFFSVLGEVHQMEPEEPMWRQRK